MSSYFFFFYLCCNFVVLLCFVVVVVVVVVLGWWRLWWIDYLRLLMAVVGWCVASGMGELDVVDGCWMAAAAHWTEFTAAITWRAQPIAPDLVWWLLPIALNTSEGSIQKYRALLLANKSTSSVFLCDENLIPHVFVWSDDRRTKKQCLCVEHWISFVW